MSRKDKLVLLNMLKEKERRIKTNKLFSYYPNTGRLRRELYQKHTQFFEAPFRERLMMAANRVGKCVAGDTLIETPDGEPKMVKDIKGHHRIWAWDGEKKVPAIAEEPFVKPSEMVYRVWLRNGQYVDCAAEHRFLSKAGWIFLSDLFECVPALPLSTSVDDRAESLSDALYLMNKHQDSRADYRPECRSNDGQLLSDASSGQVFSPLQGDAQKHNLALLRVGDLVDRCKHSLLHIADRLSNLGAALQNVVQSFGFLFQDACSGVVLCRDSRQVVLRPDLASGFQPLPIFEVGSHQSLSTSLVTPDGLSNTVLCYQPIGVQPIYDFHVPHYKNYCTQGFIHHNTEGVGGYELTLHLTGLYPDWWTGKRFDRPISSWAAGDTGKTVREIIQFKLLGKIGEFGTGLIPAKNLIKTTPKSGVPDAVDTIYVKHVSGGTSTLVLKSYDQKRIAFQGTEQDVIWLDEEPPLDIYTECLLRTMDTEGTGKKDGIIIATFTPLLGMSETVMNFLPNGQIPDGGNGKSAGSKFIVMATWDDVPHLSAKVKEELWGAIPPFQRDARSKGVPQLGSGAIFPVPESDFVVDDFQIPEHWPRAYGMDVGWNRTAVCWGALNPETDTFYLTSEHYRGQAEPSLHAEAIRARGEWIPGVIDPASRGRTQNDGNQIIQNYMDLGLDLETAFNGVESGIYEVWQRLSTGRLKVFKSMSNWLYEFRLYRRDEKGAVVKSNDHLMDATRYLVMSGMRRAKVKPAPVKNEADRYSNGGSRTGWMG